MKTVLIVLAVLAALYIARRLAVWVFSKAAKSMGYDVNSSDDASERHD